MKNKFKFSLLIFGFILLFSACTKEGDNVLTDDRDQYIGTWNCKEKDPANAQTAFNITISKTGTADSLSVSNFNNIGSIYKAVFIVSSTSIAIPTQNISGFQITNGSGFLNGNKISLSYSVDNEAYTAECTR